MSFSKIGLGVRSLDHGTSLGREEKKIPMMKNLWYGDKSVLSDIFESSDFARQETSGDSPRKSIH